MEELQGLYNTEVGPNIFGNMYDANNMRERARKYNIEKARKRLSLTFGRNLSFEKMDRVMRDQDPVQAFEEEYPMLIDDLNHNPYHKYRIRHIHQEFMTQQEVQDYDAEDIDNDRFLRQNFDAFTREGRNGNNYFSMINDFVITSGDQLDALPQMVFTYCEQMEQHAHQLNPNFMVNNYQAIIYKTPFDTQPDAPPSQVMQRGSTAASPQMHTAVQLSAWLTNFSQQMNINWTDRSEAPTGIARNAEGTERFHMDLVPFDTNSYPNIVGLWSMMNDLYSDRPQTNNYVVTVIINAELPYNARNDGGIYPDDGDRPLPRPTTTHRRDAISSKDFLNRILLGQNSSGRIRTINPKYN